MGVFYILNDVPPVNAASAKEAAQRYAALNNVNAGTVTVATGSKSFEITTTPAVVDAVAVADVTG